MGLRMLLFASEASLETAVSAEPRTIQCYFHLHALMINLVSTLR